ncbi:unnamed protein product [Spirodela intermedia]|uniref:Uncharacterized protein n=1 Tax=Spirodela intermedia TaxID=51605 RepID=A0A7I8IRI4_SPIIN|nr:unnamed protein product [Spirodela intermedia]CAA6660583.1 unnamed protein product [Spirodela intermedia]
MVLEIPTRGRMNRAHDMLRLGVARAFPREMSRLPTVKASPPPPPPPPPPPAPEKRPPPPPR